MLVLACSLRGIKVEQRTLNDNISSLVDMAKVSTVQEPFILLLIYLKLWLHVKYNYFELILKFVFYFTSDHQQCLRVK